MKNKLAHCKVEEMKICQIWDTFSSASFKKKQKNGRLHSDYLPRDYCPSSVIAKTDEKYN